MGITAAFCPFSCQSLLDRNGVPIIGGSLYAFDAGTTTARPVYSDAGLTTELPSPVKTDGFGRFPPIYVGLGNYKIVLKDASNAMLSTVDGLPGAIQTSDTPTTPSGWVTGDVKAAHTNDLQDGWLPLNGKTIGSPDSGATARANADVQSLFILLWNKDASLAVSGGRSASATTDWAASKTITLPDYRGRTVFGADQMGASAPAGVITAATTANPDTIGQALGGESETLTANHLPSTMPAITIGSAGGHTPSGTIGNAGSHYHTGTTDANGLHNHVYSSPSGYATSFGGGTGGAITAAVNANTSSDGNHTHTFTTGTVGDHTHSLTMNAVPDHVHTATSSGGGQPHSKMPPGILVYWHIKI